MIIGQYPLWLVLAVWWLQRQPRRQAVAVKLDFGKVFQRLAELRSGLPKAESWLEQAVRDWVEAWILEESIATGSLEHIGAVAVGTFPKE